MPNLPPIHRLPRPSLSDGRPSSNARGYTRQWSRYRRSYLNDHPTCAKCPAPARHVDHIRAVRGPDDPAFWDPANHQPLCHACHSRKTVQHDGGFGRPKQ